MLDIEGLHFGAHVMKGCPVIQLWTLKLNHIM